MSLVYRLSSRDLPEDNMNMEIDSSFSLPDTAPLPSSSSNDANSVPAPPIVDEDDFEEGEILDDD